MSNKAAELALDVSAEDARALHRVVRAMHDGHCPKCGHLGPSESFVGGVWREHGGEILFKKPWGVSWWLGDAHICPSCEFYILDETAEAALALFQPILHKSLEVFEHWRAALEDSSIPNNEGRGR